MKPIPFPTVVSANAPLYSPFTFYDEYKDVLLGGNCFLIAQVPKKENRTGFQIFTRYSTGLLKQLKDRIYAQTSESTRRKGINHVLRKTQETPLNDAGEYHHISIKLDFPNLSYSFVDYYENTPIAASDPCIARVCPFLDEVMGYIRQSHRYGVYPDVMNALRDALYFAQYVNPFGSPDEHMTEVSRVCALYNVESFSVLIAVMITHPELASIEMRNRILSGFYLE
jgi:hypothetical protein